MHGCTIAWSPSISFIFVTEEDLQIEVSYKIASVLWQKVRETIFTYNLIVLYTLVGNHCKALCIPPQSGDGSVLGLQV